MYLAFEKRLFAVQSAGQDCLLVGEAFVLAARAELFN